MIKEICRIEQSPTGGIIWVPIENSKGMVKISQRYMQIDNGKLVISTRYAHIVQEDGILQMTPGQLLTGDIYIKESTVPVDYDNPEDMLLWKEDGNVERTEGGKPIWQYTVYSEDENEYDELVPREKVTQDH